MQEYKLVIFDVDGTLVDSSDVIVQSFNHALDQMSTPRAEDAWIRSQIGVPLDDIFATYEPGYTDEDIQRAIDFYRAHYFEHSIDASQILPGAEALLDALYDSHSLSIATNKPAPPAQHVLDGLGLSPRLHAIYGVEAGEPMKPDPFVLHKNLKHFDIAPEETLFIGDTTYDVHAGTAAGITTIGVTTGTHSREVLEEAGAHQVVDSLEELLG